MTAATAATGDVVSRFPFRARLRHLPLVALGLGSIMVLFGLGPAPADARVFLIGAGVTGVTLGILYLCSPAWRLAVVTTEDELQVVRGQTERFALRWDAVREVVADEKKQALFVDGGEPQKSLLVPGDSTPAPYRIERAAELYALILKKVPAGRVRFVEDLPASY